MNSRQRRTHPTCHFAVCGCITYNPMDFPTLTDSSENITKVIVFSVNKSEIDSVQYNAFSSVFSSCSESKSTMVNDFTNQMKKVMY